MTLEEVQYRSNTPQKNSKRGQHFAGSVQIHLLFPFNQL
jgi:hypothetical protein